jgi:FMN-dependent NADH-azoreductase
MKRILFLECSPHAQDSLSAGLVLRALAPLESQHHGVRVITRNLALDPLAMPSARYARAITASAQPDDPAFALSESLISELESSDGLLICTPLHNFTVPATLKLWIDLVLRRGRSFTVGQDGKVGLLRDRPALVLLRSGSQCAGEGSTQPDFLTPYLRHVLSVIGIHNVQFVYLPGSSPTAEALAQACNALHSLFFTSLSTGAPP